MSASQGIKQLGHGTNYSTPFHTKGFERLRMYPCNKAEVCSANHLPIDYFVTVNVSSPERETTFICHQLFQRRAMGSTKLICKGN